jgi:hypothetical protein
MLVMELMIGCINAALTDGETGLLCVPCRWLFFEACPKGSIFQMLAYQHVARMPCSGGSTSQAIRSNPDIQSQVS